jgi:hypothetical protein
VLLIASILALDIVPGGILDTLSTSVNAITGPPPPMTDVVANATR